jgi:ABC-type amino acid transport substrate-binding protein
MPSLRNARRERFAVGLANGLSATQAYEAAGYKPDRGNAARLTANDSIRLRVAELQERKAEAAVFDRVRIMQQLSGLYRHARKLVPILNGNGQTVGEEITDARTALNCLKLIGTELGMFGKPKAFEFRDDIDRLSDKELIEYINELRAGLRATVPGLEI